MVTWADHAERAVETALDERYPMKPRWERVRKAERLVARLDHVVNWYHQGAAAALFDLLDFCGTFSVPLPPPLLSETADLLEAALLGTDLGFGKGADAPLKGHRAALTKRLRWAQVEELLQTEEEYREADARAVREWGADPGLYAQWQAKRQGSTELVTKACELVRDEHARHVTWQAIRKSWAEVGAAYHAADAHAPWAPSWPGIFYVPTAETLERLGWEEMLPLIHQHGGPDFPDLGMV